MDTNDSLYTDPKPSNEPAANAEPTKAVQRRRKFSIEQKRHIVEDALTSGESISVAARRHNVNANLLFKWRQQYEQGQLEPETETVQLVPVTVTPENAQVPVPQQSRFPRAGRLDIALANGHRLTITGSACPATLRTVLESLGT